MFVLQISGIVGLSDQSTLVVIDWHLQVVPFRITTEAIGPHPAMRNGAILYPRRRTAGAGEAVIADHFQG